MLPEPLGRGDASLHNEDGPRPLAHPLVLDLSYFGVRVAHHGDQQVQQQDDHNRNEDEEVDLADELMVGVWDSIPNEADIA